MSSQMGSLYYVTLANFVILMENKSVLHFIPMCITFFGKKYKILKQIEKKILETLRRMKLVDKWKISSHGTNLNVHHTTCSKITKTCSTCWTNVQYGNPTMYILFTIIAHQETGVKFASTFPCEKLI